MAMLLYYGIMYMAGAVILKEVIAFICRKGISSGKG